MLKHCKKQKRPRNISMTKRYLNKNGLMAIPFDKGIGICLMSSKTYIKKLCEIIHLSQFKKVLPTRKNAKHPLLK